MFTLSSPWVSFWKGHILVRPSHKYIGIMLSNVVWNTICLKLTFLKSLFCWNATSTLPLCLVLFAKLLGPHCPNHQLHITSATLPTHQVNFILRTTWMSWNYQILQSTEWLKFIPLLSKLSSPEKKTTQFQVAQWRECLFLGFFFVLGEMGVFIRRCKNWVNLNDNCKHT